MFDPNKISLSRRYNITDVCSYAKYSHIERKRIADHLLSAPVAVRTIPKLSNIASGAVKLSTLQPLDINDLLGRDPVAPNQILMTKNIMVARFWLRGQERLLEVSFVDKCKAWSARSFTSITVSIHEIHQELINNDANAK